MWSKDGAIHGTAVSHQESISHPGAGDVCTAGSVLGSVDLQGVLGPCKMNYTATESYDLEGSSSCLGQWLLDWLLLNTRVAQKVGAEQVGTGLCRSFGGAGPCN